MPTVEQIAQAINQLAPFAAAADFDNVGLLIGDPKASVTRAVVALDATREALEQATQLGAQLVITHHPVIFHPLKKLLAGSLPYAYVRAGVSVIAAHTNLDAAEGGVGDCLAAALGLLEVRPFEGSEGMGRLGRLPQPMEAAAFIRFVDEKLHTRARCTSKTGVVRQAAVLGGGGDFAWEAARAAGADAFVTGESKHHILLAAQQAGFCYIDAGHYETESVVCGPLRNRLAAVFPKVTFVVADQQPPASVN